MNTLNELSEIQMRQIICDIVKVAPNGEGANAIALKACKQVQDALCAMNRRQQASPDSEWAIAFERVYGMSPTHAEFHTVEDFRNGFNRSKRR